MPACQRPQLFAASHVLSHFLSQTELWRLGQNIPWADSPFTVSFCGDLSLPLLRARQGECARGIIEGFDDEMTSCGVRVSDEQLLCNVEMNRVFVATASSSSTWLVQAVEQGCQVWCVLCCVGDALGADTGPTVCLFCDLNRRARGFILPASYSLPAPVCAIGCATRDP